MKRSRIGSAGFAFAFAMLGSSGIYAAPNSAVSYVFYSGATVVGQSIRNCDGVTQHWGDARSDNLASAVAVSFSCSSGLTTSVTYPGGLDPFVKAGFCTESSLCEVGPWPMPGAPPLVPGLYSD
jgi:hypothetical protein